MIGLAFSPEAQLGVLAAVVVGGVLVEPAWERRTRAAEDKTARLYPLCR